MNTRRVDYLFVEITKIVAQNINGGPLALRSIRIFTKIKKTLIFKHDYFLGGLPANLPHAIFVNEIDKLNFSRP